MDMSSAEWSSHLELEDPTIISHDQYQTMMMMMMPQNCFEFDEPINDIMMFDCSNNSTDSGLISAHHQIQDHDVQQEMMMIKTEEEIVAPAKATANSSRDWRSSCPSKLSNSPSTGGQIISFGSSDDHDDDQEYCDIIKPKKTTHQKRMSKLKTSSSVGLCLPSCSQQHVLAERKRREIMTHNFLHLSALIPHLSKMDKASILGEAAKKLKELEERLKLLEEQTAERTVESVVLVKKRKDPNVDGINSCSNENSLLEIEAKVSKKNVLIRIHCHQDKGLAQKLLNEIEKLHLTTLNCSTMPFGGYAMNIILIAQMDDNLNMTMKDLVMHLKLALQ